MSKKMQVKKQSTKYDILLEDLRALMAQARGDIMRLSKRIVVVNYWKMGERIVKEGLPEESTFRIAQDLGADPSVLSRAVTFYEQWPKGCPEDVGDQVPALGWGHYRVLMNEKSPARRKDFLNQARQQNWNRAQLQENIASAKMSKVGGKTPKAGPLKPLNAALFTYSAKIESIVDGDTLELMVDLGFDVWTLQRIRLRGINTPEVKTKEGAAAKAYVQDQLKNCERIVVKTTRRIDMYGRYIGDIFYLPGQQRGRSNETDREKILQSGTYLNNKLLTAGYAQRY